MAKAKKPTDLGGDDLAKLGISTHYSRTGVKPILHVRVDIGNLPPSRAEAYLKKCHSLMVKCLGRSALRKMKLLVTAKDVNLEMVFLD